MLELAGGGFLKPQPAPVQVAAPMNDVQLIAMLASERLGHVVCPSEKSIEEAVRTAGDILAETMRQHPANQRKLAEAVR